MYCEGCGAQLEPGQQYCPRCGRTLAGVVTGRASRVSQHARLLGILWIAYSALHLIGGGVLLVIANTLFGHMGRFGPPAPPTFLQPLLSFIGVLLLAKAIAGLAAGIGLLQCEPWARTLTVVMAIISLINVPFGTALGIYSLWVLLSPNAENEYRAMAQRA